VYWRIQFIQLMDDDTVSLIALRVIVNPSCRDDPRHVLMRQLYLSLYLMTQSQTKLHQPVTSLAQAIFYVEVACRNLDAGFRHTLDQLL